MRRIVGIALLALLALVVVLNWTWGALPDEGRPTGRFARIDGVRVRYVERAGADPAIVLIHGLPGTADDFAKVAPLLRGHRTIAYDRPGFGFSDGGYHPMDEQVSVLRGLLERLGVRQAVLVGHSYGGTLALVFAERHPELVRGLVLVDAAAAGQRSGFLDRAQSRLVQVLSWPVVQPIADATFSRLLRTLSAKRGDHDAFAPNRVDAGHERRLLARNMRHEDLDAYAGEELAANGEIAQLDARLKRIDAPVVVIQGDADRLVEPKHGRRLAATLPHARLVMVHGGHMVPYVHPDVVATAVRRVLAGR